MKVGIEPVWASEIEKFPIKVTEHHFPYMYHLGDIRGINGAQIEPVDLITFGSPCQNLSVAGKGEGLKGAQSSLFFEAIRVIREMREATHGRYPRFALWENVPGTFNSNRGQDFRAVLEEIVQAKIPMPQSGRWATADMVRGGKYSVAWRVLDAKYFGVPQRRKRVFLIADFASQCAPEILFEQPCLPRHFETGREEGQKITGSIRSSIKTTGTEYLTGWDHQEKRVFGVNSVSPTLAGSDGGGGRSGVGYVAVPYTVPKSYRIVNSGEYGADDCASTVKARDYKGSTDLILADQPELFDMTHADEVIRPVTPGLAPTLNARRMGTGGNQIPVMLQLVAFNGRQDPVVYKNVTGALDTDRATQCVAFGPGGQHDTAYVLRAQPSKADKPDSCTYIVEIVEPIPVHDKATRYMGGGGTRNNDGAGNGLGIGKEGDPCPTITAGDRHAIFSVNCRSLYENKEVSGTLQCKVTGGHSLNYQNPIRISYMVRRLTPLECERLMGFPDNWTNIPRGSDTARYKALGNSVVVNCVEFIFKRLIEVMKKECV